MIYENLTDEELLRVADGQAGLIKALAERLEMRLRDIKEIDNPTQVEDDRQLKLF
jgi:hypothetical protein